MGLSAASELGQLFLGAGQADFEGPRPLQASLRAELSAIRSSRLSRISIRRFCWDGSGRRSEHRTQAFGRFGGQGPHHGVEEGPGFEGVTAAVPVHVAPLVVVPQIPLGLVDVLLPQAHSHADIAWPQIVAGALETGDLRQAREDRPSTTGLALVVGRLPGMLARIRLGRLRGMDLSVRRHARHGATMPNGVSKELASNSVAEKEAGGRWIADEERREAERRRGSQRGPPARAAPGTRPERAQPAPSTPTSETAGTPEKYLGLLRGSCATTAGHEHCHVPISIAPHVVKGLLHDRVTSRGFAARAAGWVMMVWYSTGVTDSQLVRVRPDRRGSGRFRL